MLYSLKIIFIPIGLSLFVACSSSNEVDQQNIPQLVVEPTDSFSGLVYRIEGTDSFGYIISQNGKKLIQQTFIPAMQGRMPITDSIAANRLMEKSMEKLANGQFPPSLSLKEVLSLLELE